jgi:hypothetical protein
MAKKVKDATTGSAVSEGFPDKFKKLLPEGYEETAASYSNEELEKLIVKSRGLIADTVHDMETDEKLAGYKAQLKDIMGGFRDAMKAEDAKIMLALYLLRDRGAR